MGRQRILGDNAHQVLSGLTFFVASPALLFETLSKAQLGDVFAEPLLVTAVSAVCTALVFFSIVKFVLKRALPEALMSSMAASLANSANLGIPIAVYVLGDASYVAPLLIFQLAFFTPVFLMILDASTSSHRTTPWGFILMILRNPMPSNLWSTRPLPTFLPASPWVSKARRCSRPWWAGSSRTWPRGPGPPPQIFSAAR
ncbi:putative permease [Arthrobacter sp. UYEF6]